MKEYNSEIKLIKNSRGVYDLDTSKGCFSGMLNNKKGCYGECYAARFANQYGYDFSKTVLRGFCDVKSVDSIRSQIRNIDMPFVRIGVTGDPSENWEHTLSIVNLISGIKPIVIITKHWNALTETHLKSIMNYDICINTSVSALDNSSLLKHRLKQYDVLKSYCKSVLRIVSCDFNTKNLKGAIYNDIQNKLFENNNVLDNVLRVSKNNDLVRLGVINIKKDRFLSSKSYFSKSNKRTYTGECEKCPDMCGININN